MFLIEVMTYNRCTYCKAQEPHLRTSINLKNDLDLNVITSLPLNEESGFSKIC